MLEATEGGGEGGVEWGGCLLFGDSFPRHCSPLPSRPPLLLGAPKRPVLFLSVCDCKQGPHFPSAPGLTGTEEQPAL